MNDKQWETKALECPKWRPEDNGCSHEKHKYYGQQPKKACHCIPSLCPKGHGARYLGVDATQVKFI